ncbi:cofilin, actophorin [Aspergillus sclerotiicarbonarius CBS 121057]|uniref:Cofilin n=1 Tax=Aspergillus sclerotiicarbonarius (strain CBS 121057 / IBT 28362) TaxID=1448318 RepID=A0A319DYI1_ASPSB|nr:cofilin, actophorin [Aspergillus sclerotiicarbonarius CBS 121057]
MALPSGVTISNECINAFRDLLYKKGASKPAFIIYKISDDEQSIVVEESSSENNYEAFLQKLTSALDHEGNRAPRYAVYDVEYDLNEDGRRTTTVFISWMPDATPTRLRMLYASTKEQLRKALDVKVSIHADDLYDIEWTTVLSEASGGRL